MNIFRTSALALILALVLAFGALAQTDVAFDPKTGINSLVNPTDISHADQFSPDYIIELNVRAAVAAANAFNAVKVSSYKQDVANFRLQSAGGKIPVNPVPVVPDLKSVNADTIRAKLSVFPFSADLSEVVTLVKYAGVLPLTDPTPAPAAQPDDPVGADTGNGNFACKAGDTTKDGAQKGNSRGVFQKHLVTTPFGASCWWTLLFAVSN